MAETYLDKTDRLEKAATKGPWETGLDQRNVCIGAGSHWWKPKTPGIGVKSCRETRQAESDAAFIAHAREAVPFYAKIAREYANRLLAEADRDEQSGLPLDARHLRARAAAILAGPPQETNHDPR